MGTQRARDDDGAACRLIVALPGRFECVLQRFERLVPVADPLAMSAARSHHQRLLAAQANTPHGFMRHYRADLPHDVSGSSMIAGVEYLVGNYAVAAAALARDPSAVLWASVRTVLYSDSAGATYLAVDQPSANLGGRNPELITLAQRLDAYLAQLIGLLHGCVPLQLRFSAGEFYDCRGDA